MGKGAISLERRIAFVESYYAEVARGKRSMLDLCAEFGFSRKTGYEFRARHQEGGIKGLVERSRAPHGGEHWIEADVVERVLSTRLEFPHWGAETILDYLEREDPEIDRPGNTTAHGWLRKAGLVERKRRGRRFPHPGRPPREPVMGPNEQWSTDFKGHFRTGDRKYCYALTVVDSFSRYLLDCRALTDTSFESVWPRFEHLFREHGLPQAILSDNGTPFSSNSVKRLSKLSVRWIRLGIVARLTEPGKPYQNGRHERVHAHMKPLVCATPSRNAREQQRQFDWFIDHHNNVRPHRELNKHVPAELYVPSPRPYPKRLPTMEYPAHLEVRRVRSSGEIRWDGQWFFLSDALVGEPVAFEQVNDDIWVLRYGPIELGYYSAPTRQLVLDRPRPDGKAENARVSRFPTGPATRKQQT